jgi:aminobenzoyl-glutamate transport protein
MTDESETADGAGKRTFVMRALDRVERIGNRLPDPFTLFVAFAVLVAAISWLAASAGVAVVHPGTGATIEAVNLLNAAGIRRMLTEAVRNFAAFPPLGTVLVAMLGIGVAERSGLIATALKLLVQAVPKSALTPTVVFAGIMSSMAADAGYVVLTPLGAVVFAGIGRHPIAGLAAAFAGVSGGFSANLLLTSLDPLLAGLTEPAAQMVEPGYTVAATSNYYFMVASVFLVTLVGSFVTERFVEPRLGTYKPLAEDGEATDAASPLAAVTSREKRALLFALLAFAACLAATAALVVPSDGALRSPEGGLEPFYGSIVALLTLGFLVPGLVYGVAAGTIASDKDVAKMSSDTLNTMGSYIVLAFAAAQFVAYFSWSNLGLILAVNGAGLLQTIGISGVPLLLGFILVSAFLNLFIGSASAKWAIMAPVFVPMLMLMGYSPESVQAAYRVGDSVTNIITPLLPYFPIVIAFARKYDPDVGLGTLISAMLPYSVAFFLAWCVLFTGWIVLDLPLGPNAPLLYEAAGAARG